VHKTDIKAIRTIRFHQYTLNRLRKSKRNVGADAKILIDAYIFVATFNWVNVKSVCACLISFLEFMTTKKSFVVLVVCVIG
jgi:hypothetical protein